MTVTTESGLIIEADSALPLFHLSVTSPRGALFDPIGKEGAVRLLLKLMRRSTVGMKSDEIDESLDALGATLGPDVRRSASGFHGSAISRSAESYLDLVARLISSPHFDEKEFERIRKEALADWIESLDNDSVLARRAFTRAFYADHPYGRLSGGTPESLERLTLDDLESLHASLFRIDSLLVTVAGDVPPQLARQLSARLAQAASGATARVDAPPPSPAGPRGRHLTFVDKPERTQTQIMIGCLGTQPLDDDHTALYVGHTIFGGTFGARLSREVRGKRGWSYGAYSDLPYDRQRQAFTLWTFPQASDAADCIALELSMLEKFIEKGVTKSELSAAKRYLKNSQPFSVDTAAKRASQIQDRLIYGLPEDYHSGFAERVSALTVEDVNSAIQNRLSHENLEITVLGTQADILSDIENAISDLSGRGVLAYDARA